MTTAGMLLESGVELAGFRVDRLIAEGGMGTVYRATQLRLDREVALKVLSPERGLDREFRERFIRESKVAASLDHPNVLPVYDAGEAEGVTYLAMRYVKGGDLRNALREHGRLPVALALEITRQIALALDAAHRAGLVHRDVKPANILLAAEDHAYLADFGLVRSENARGLTRSGAFMGSPDYVAPEQVEGLTDVDGRADIYSLGCVLYHCLAGQPPYGRQSEIRALMAHLHEPTPLLSQVRPDLPEGVSSIAAKAMAKDRAARYSTGANLVAALSDLLGDPRPARAHGIERRSAGEAHDVVPASENSLGRTQVVDRFDTQTGFAPTANSQARPRYAGIRSHPPRRRWVVAGGGALIATIAVGAVLIPRSFSGPETPRASGPGPEKPRAHTPGPGKPRAHTPAPERPLAVAAVRVADHSAVGGYDRRVKVSFVARASTRRPVTQIQFKVKGPSRHPRFGFLKTTRSPAFINGLVNGDPYRIQLRACHKKSCSRTWSPRAAPVVVPFGHPYKPRIVFMRARGNRVAFRWQSQSNGRSVNYLLRLTRKGLPSTRIHLGPHTSWSYDVGYAAKGAAIVCAIDSVKAESCSRPRSFLTPPETYLETAWIKTHEYVKDPGVFLAGWIQKGQKVQIACRIKVETRNQGYQWFYQIASPEKNNYYARTGAFYNDKRTSGVEDPSRDPAYDSAVQTCDGIRY